MGYYISENLLDNQAKSNDTSEQLKMLYDKLGNYKSQHMVSFKGHGDLKEKVFLFRFNSSYEKGNIIDNFLIQDRDNNQSKLISFYNDYLVCPRK